MEGIQVSAEVAGSRNQISIIKVGGYIDTTTSSELERSLDSLLKQGRFFLIVDLGNVDYISSAGLRVFLSTAKQLKGFGGELRLCNLNETVQEIFDMSGFSTILGVFKIEKDALADW